MQCFGCSLVEIFRDSAAVGLPSLWLLRLIITHRPGIRNLRLVLAPRLVVSNENTGEEWIRSFTFLFNDISY